MALLDGMQGGGGGMDGLDPNMIAQIMAMLQQQQGDPFMGAMPGDDMLGAGGMQMPQQMQQAPTQGGGLPMLPEDMAGMGLGATAPQETQPQGIRGQLIEQLMQMLMQGGGM